MANIGRYDEALEYTNGRPVLGASVLVKTTAAATASLFTDEGGLTSADNPIDYVPTAAGKTGLDALGNLVFHASADSPGPYYDIVVTPSGGSALTARRVRVVLTGVPTLIDGGTP